AGDRDSYVVLDWLPGLDRAEFERGLLEARGNATLAGLLRPLLPDRLVTTLLSAVGLEDATRARGLTRKQRTDLVRILFEHRVEVDGDRGYTFAEATAGGVPLSEVRLDSMESRIVPGFHLVGEVLDVDGRVGGFNFQWAWATGHVAGVAIAGTLARA
ncbi:MAG: NAD(P)/FAD-dependent oxidoreductase, partial [Planctomycetota bacterium]|nr:NAD(P)/FAD-dependent oxidoreductase [Planctomycetota bacterium]